MASIRSWTRGVQRPVIKLKKEEKKNTKAKKTKTIILRKRTESTAKPKPKLVPLKKSDKHIINIREILKSTNATPIRRHAGIGYTCCYCEQQFPEPTALKQHTLDTHEDLTEATFMKVKTADYIVKLDITHLKCTLCDTNINTLEDLMQHLKVEHKKKIFTDIPNHILPFKFDTEVLTCFMCLNVFNKFKMLLGHMQTHYKNYVCEICDAGFVNKHGITNHRLRHQNGSFVCQYCPKVFKSHQNKKTHERAVHILCNMLHKCPYCGDKFYNTRYKDEHMEKVHGTKSMVNLKCNACEKVFKSQYLLTIHTKRDHLLERRHQCDECGKKFYTKPALTNHMVSHTGSKDFQCGVCLKAYGRKKTLREHMKIHNDDRRFKCEHCGQAFVQKCSWRGHVRSKHGEQV